jgi:hypothetical protein
VTYKKLLKFKKKTQAPCEKTLVVKKKLTHVKKLEQPRKKPKMPMK